MASRASSRLSLIFRRTFNAPGTFGEIRGSSGLRQLSTDNEKKIDFESMDQLEGASKAESDIEKKKYVFEDIQISQEKQPEKNIDSMKDVPLFGDDWTRSGPFGPQGVYKAILLGEVGHAPIQKILRSGRSVTVFSIATGGMRNNRQPFDGETPMEFAQRSAIQWHRVAIYRERIGELAIRYMKQGSYIYVEGNLETRIYSDPVTGLVKRIREVAIRQNGRLLFMDQPINQSSLNEVLSDDAKAQATL